MLSGGRARVGENNAAATAADAAELLNDKAASPPPQNIPALCQCKVVTHTHRRLLLLLLLHSKSTDITDPSAHPPLLRFLIT